jgi:hypothetical protein
VIALAQLLADLSLDDAPGVGAGGSDLFRLLDGLILLAINIQIRTIISSEGIYLWLAGLGARP